MNRAWTIARHTVREAVRMKIVLAFACLVFILIFTLPVGIQRPDASLSSIVQTFLTWSLIPLGIILSYLAVFLGCLSISEEMFHKQIHMLVSKPLPRWQYIIGKWLGVVVVLTGLLIFAGVAIYGMARYLASLENKDTYDAAKLQHEVLTARAHSPLEMPDFTADAEIKFQQLKEEGRYSGSSAVAERKIKDKLVREMIQQWRSVPVGGIKEYKFQNIMIADRSPDHWLQLRYKAKGLGYSPDEVLQMVWVFGNPRDADQVVQNRRDVKDRYHTVPFPASAVSPDGTLYVWVQNLDHLRRSGHQGATIAFEAQEGFEVLYKIGTFGGNLVRTLFLIWCRVVLLAGVAVFAASFVSFPVACLITFCFYLLSVSSKYVISAMDFGTPGEGVLGPAHFVIEPVLKAIFWAWPKFGNYDGISTFVDGRNVTLMWDLQAFSNLVLFLTTAFLLTACIIFRRRQVAELSI